MGGGVKFSNNRIQVQTEMEQAGISWLYEACGEIEAQTKRNSKVITGETKGSYQYSVDEATLTGMVGSGHENAIWEEFGTGEYALHGDGRKGGWYYKDASGKGHFTYGKKPKRPFFRAYHSMKAILIESCREYFRRLGG